MGVASVSRLAVFINQLADDLNTFASGMSSLHHNTSQFAVVDTSLRVRSHINQFLTVLGPDITNSDAVLVETTIGQWRRKAFEVRVFHGKVPGSVSDLGDLNASAWQFGVFGDTDGESGIRWVRPGREEL